MSERIFSEDRHREGAWNTAPIRGRNPFVRALLNHLSLKRRGVSRLSRALRPDDLVLDLGCGTGAYGQWIRSTKPIRLVSVDWALSALVSARERNGDAGIYICADIGKLPFKPAVFQAFYSIDTLGHTHNSDCVLDECFRVLETEGRFFLHSECSDYKRRWPDRELIRLLGRDVPALQDGHIGLRRAADLCSALRTRFTLEKAFSPAGLLGWLIGYPEKYQPAFRAAGCTVPYALSCIFAKLKRPLATGVLLRLLNAWSNKLELLLGITGGGSFFAHGKKGNRPDGEPL